MGPRRPKEAPREFENLNSVSVNDFEEFCDRWYQRKSGKSHFLWEGGNYDVVI